MPLDSTTPPMPRRDPPWMAGLRAARANLAPGLIVQALMLAMLLAYYFYSPTRDWLNRLAEIKTHWSYGYTALSSIFAGAIIPELLKIGVFQQAKIHRSNFENLLFTVPFYCVMGMIVDFLYRCQAGWFGTEVTFAVVLKKVLVDQFLYNPLFSAPVCAWLYDWKHRGFKFQGTGVFFTATYYRNVILPILFATWGVWIPIVTILYSLPLPLQIPLFGLALSLWVMIYTWMSEQRARPRQFSPDL